jgi:hypothetical protein
LVRSKRRERFFFGKQNCGKNPPGVAESEEKMLRDLWKIPSSGAAKTAKELKTRNCSAA